MIEVPRMVKKIQRLSDVPFYYILYDHLREVSEADVNHDYFKAFSICCSLYESFGKNILVNHIKNKGLSFDLKKLKDLRLNPLILMLYTHGLISEGTYSDMVSVNKTRNDLIHQYADRFLSPSVLKEIKENKGKIMKSLKDLNGKYESNRFMESLSS